MNKVTGVGGIFFKCENPEKLYSWYGKHLGIKQDVAGEGAMFKWRDVDDPNKSGYTVWSLFPKDTQYFGTSRSGFMINYRVENLDELIEELKKEGIEVLGKEDYDYGRFAWIMDPEGNRIELWEPPKK